MTTKELSVKYDIPMHILMSMRRYLVRSAADTTLVAYERESLTSDEWHDITSRTKMEEELHTVNKQLARAKEITMINRVYIPRWFDANLYKENAYTSTSDWPDTCHGEQVYVYLDDVPMGALYIVGTDRYIVNGDEECVLKTFVTDHAGRSEYYSFSYAEVDGEPQQQ